MKRIQKGLFFLPNSAAFTFQIFPVESVKGQSVLCDYIELAGGICLDADDNGPDDDKYAIPLIDINWLHEHNIKTFRKPKDDCRDFFKADYVYDCYTNDQLFDLNKYKFNKLTTPIMESINYDANKILRRELSWDQICAQASKNKNTKTILVRQPRSSISSTSPKNSPSKDKTIQNRSPNGSSPIKNPIIIGSSPNVSSSKSSSASPRHQNIMNNSIEHDTPKSVRAMKSPIVIVKIEEQDDIDMEIIEEIPVKNNVKDMEGETSSKYFPSKTVNQEVLQNQKVTNNVPKSSTISTSTSKPENLKRTESSAISKSPSKPDNLKRTESSAISKTSSTSKPENLKRTESSTISKASSKIRRMSSDSDSSSVPSLNGSSDFETSTRPRPTVPIEQRMKCGRSYTLGESALILKYICENHLHSLTGGLNMWKEMEAKKIVKGRTHQSLKEHFRKFVLKNLAVLKCSKEDQEEFKLALQNRGGKGGRKPTSRKQGRK